jgi:hypothetical protein
MSRQARVTGLRQRRPGNVGRIRKINQVMNIYREVATWTQAVFGSLRRYDRMSSDFQESDRYRS